MACRKKLRQAWRLNYLSHFSLVLSVRLGSEGNYSALCSEVMEYTEDRSRSVSRLIVRTLFKTFQFFMYIYIYGMSHIHSVKGDEREERAEICKKKGSGRVLVQCAKWMQRWRSERPAWILRRWRWTPGRVDLRGRWFVSCVCLDFTSLPDI